MKNTPFTKLVYTLTIAAGVLAGNYAFAQSAGTNTPNIDQRQNNQQTRINNGVANGSITPAEQAKLQNQQTKIANDKSAAKADGVVTKQERKKLHKEQNHANRNIAKKKHNRKQTAPSQ